MPERIRYRTSEAKIEIFTGIYLVLLLMLLLSVQTQIRVFMATSIYVEDALAASNLASAVMDYREYGRSRRITIADPREAYQLYLETLKKNLCLDDNWESARKSLIHGQVQVLKYEIYEVENNDVTVYSFGPEGEGVKFIADGLGSVYTPDKILVESTSVYSKVGFPVKGIFGIQITAAKEKTVDIVSNPAGDAGGS